MQNYEVKLEHVGKAKSDPFGQKQWAASVRFSDGSGMCYFGETPQAALSGLAMYWAQSDVQDSRRSDGVQIIDEATEVTPEMYRVHPHPYKDPFPR